MQLTFRPFQETDRRSLIDLWDQCGLLRPWNDPDTDIDQAIRNETSTILVGSVDGLLVASVMVGFDGHRGWVYYVAVDPARQRKGGGRQAMSEAERWLRDRGCRKIQLMVRDSNEEAERFYTSIGYETQAVRTIGKWFD